LFAKDADERRRLLADHPELLSTDAEQILEKMADDSRSRGNAKSAAGCDEHVALLRDCRQRMLEPINTFFSAQQIELAFVEFTHGFHTLSERKEYLLMHPELLGDRLVAAAKIPIDEYATRGRSDIAATFRLYRNLLLRCREVPIDQAFMEYEVPPSDVISAFNSIWNCDTVDETLTCGLIHSELLGSHWMKNVINFHRVKFEDNPAALERLEQLLSANPQWEWPS